MRTNRSRAMALCATLTFCCQFLLPWGALAQTAPSTGSSYNGTASGGSMQTTSTATAPAPVVPTANISGAPLPTKAVISPDLAASISNGVTNSGNVVIDFGALQGGVLDHGSSNFTNSGTIYAISTNPAITTATISAQNIYNQAGATITTVAPSGILAQYSNIVANLNLVLNAVQSVVNAGTISSAGNLTVNAGTSIINALPTNVASTVPQPVMQAMNNVNLNSASIANAGLIQSMTSNINVATTALAATQNIVFNNVGGTLQALQGAVNVRDSGFAGKFNTSILGGDILSRELNLYCGDGLLDVQLQNMTGDLTVHAGDGYISALSDIHVANVVFTGDPIVKSGSNIVFESDKDENGNPTGICTGGGQFSGTNALIAGDVRTISISGAILDLSGSAQLGSLPITSASSFIVNAQGNITVNSIGAGSAIILKSSGGSVSAGTLSAGDFIQLEAASNVTAGDLTSHAGGVIVHAPDLHVGNIKALDQPGFVDIKAQIAGPLIVGSSSDPSAPAANIASIVMTGISPTRNAWINIDNPAGVTIRSAPAVTVNTFATFSGLSMNAQAGTVTLPSGTMTFKGGNFAISAENIVANGTTIDCSGAGGPGGVIFLGARNIDRGTGLTLNTDGADNLGSGIGIGGKQSVGIVTFFDGVNNERDIFYSGTVAAPFSITGSGALTATSRGSVNGGNIFVDSLSTATLSGGAMTFNADGTGTGNGGFVQMFNNYIVNNVQSSQGVKLTANGAGTGNGGFAQAVANNFDANLTLKPGLLTLSATSGSQSGNGGTIDTKAGGMLSVDPAAITTGAVGLQGNAQRLTIVGGTRGFNGGGITFTKGGTLSNNGKGSGYGGLVQIGAFGNDSDLSYSAGGIPVNVSANGGVNGNGGFITSQAGHNLDVRGTMSADAGSSGGQGGTIDVFARLPADGGTGTYSQNNGTLTAKGSGVGDGGFIRARGPSVTMTNSSIEVDGANGGTAVVQGGSNVDIQGSVVSASAQTSGNGGFVEVDSGFAAPGNLHISDSVVNANAAGTGNGGVILNNSLQGDYVFADSTGTAAMTADGNRGQISPNGLNLQGANIAVNAATNIDVKAGLFSSTTVSTQSASEGGSIALRAGTTGSGAISVGGTLTADSIGTGRGGDILLSYQSLQQPLVISGTVSATAQGEGNSGHVITENRADAPQVIELSGTVSATSVSGTNASWDIFDAKAIQLNIRQNVVTGKFGKIDAPLVFSAKESIQVRSDDSSKLTIKSLVSSDGYIGIVLKGHSSSVDILKDGKIEAKNTIGVMASSLINNGTIQCNSSAGLIDIFGSGISSSAHNIAFHPTDAFELLDLNEFASGGTLQLTNNGTIHVQDVPATGGTVHNNYAVRIFAYTKLTLDGEGSISGPTKLQIDTLGNLTGQIDVTGKQVLRVNNVPTIQPAADIFIEAPFVQINSGASILTEGSGLAGSRLPFLVMVSKEITNDGNITVGALTGNSTLQLERPGKTFNSTAAAMRDVVLLGNGTIKSRNVLVNAVPAAVDRPLGTVSLHQNEMQGAGLQAGRLDAQSEDFSLKLTAGSIILGNISANTGNLLVELQSTAEKISIADSSRIVATLGNVSVLNRNTGSGTIEIGSNSTIQAGQQITIAITSGTATNTAGPSPTSQQFSVRPEDVNKIFFGPKGIDVNGTGNKAVLNGGSLVFDDESTGTQQNILLNSNTNFLTGSAVVVLPHGQGGGIPGPPASGTGLPYGLHGETTPAFGSSDPGHGGRPPGQAKKANNSDNRSHFIPVAFYYSTVPNAEHSLGYKSTRTAELRHSGEIDLVEDEDGSLILNQGELLVQATSTTRVRLDDVSVELKPGCTVLLVRTQDGFIVRSLFDMHDGSVNVLSRNSRIQLAPGDQLCSGQISQAVATRHLQTLSDPKALTRSEFSFPSLVVASPTMRIISRASSAKDERMFAQVLKMAACISVVTSRRGAYSLQPDYPR